MSLEIKVKEVMRPYVVTIEKEKSVLDAARKMKKEDVGSVIVIENLKPIGIVTREDITIKVAAENKLPSEVLVKEIMNQPLVTCKKDDDIMDVAMIMNKYGYERLPVVDENNNLVGIISVREILAIAPGIIEVFKERLENRLETFEKEEREEVEEETLEGECELCGNYSDELKKINAIWVCSECAEREGFGEKD